MAKAPKRRRGAGKASQRHHQASQRHRQAGGSSSATVPLAIFGVVVAAAVGFFLLQGGGGAGGAPAGGAVPSAGGSSPSTGSREEDEVQLVFRELQDKRVSAGLTVGEAEKFRDIDLGIARGYVAFAAHLRRRAKALGGGERRERAISAILDHSGMSAAASYSAGQPFRDSVVDELIEGELR